MKRPRLSSQFHIGKFGLSNFLSYSSQKPIEMGALNVFVGQNSAGKSTILHALALLSETVLDASPNSCFLLSGNGLNLGSFQNVVHRNRKNKSIAFDLTLSPVEVGSEELRQDPRSRWVPNRLVATFLEDRVTGETYVSMASIYKGSKRYFSLQGNPKHSRPAFHPAELKLFQDIEPRFDHFLPFFSVTAPSLRSYNHPLVSTNRFSRQLEALLRNMVYIGPSRAPLDTVYLISGRQPEKLDSEGHGVIPFIRSKLRTSHDRNRFRRELQEWLGDRFGLVNTTELQKLGDSPAFRFRGKDPIIKAAVSLSNTGYGVSQILPLVVQLALGDPCVLLIEQPEIHLHPRAQAELADLLVEFVKKGYQLFVETHSEHLILRLRALVASKRIPVEPSKIKIFVVKKTKRGSQLENAELTGKGGLSRWPDGFFSASSADIVTLLKQGSAV